jgi:hypothetical protein
MEDTLFHQPRWIRVFIIAGAVYFMSALFIAALFEADIRLLHTFQALIYVAIIVLTRRNNAWGFGIGCLNGAFWNYIFIRGAADKLWLLLTGQLFRPDLLLQAIAAVANFMIIIACLTAFIRMKPETKRWAAFLTGGLLAIGYLIALIVVLRPAYIPLLKSVFGL